MAEFYNDKGKSFVPALAFLSTLNPIAGDIDTFVAAAFTGALAAYDAAIVVWKNKIFWNYCYPIFVWKPTCSSVGWEQSQSLPMISILT